jgi:hypothetical protein
MDMSSSSTLSLIVSRLSGERRPPDAKRLAIYVNLAFVRAMLGLVHGSPVWRATPDAIAKRRRQRLADRSVFEVPHAVTARVGEQAESSVTNESVNRTVLIEWHSSSSQARERS